MKRKLLFVFIAFITSSFAFGQLNEGFEGATFPPDGWTNTTISGHAWQQSTSTAHGGSNSAEFEGAGFSGDNGDLITPRLDLTASGSDELTFWIKNEDWGGDQNVCKVYISTDGGTNWALLATYDTDIDAFEQKTLDLETGITQTDDAYIKFWGEDNYGYGVFIDDVVGPALFVAACPAPTAQTEANFTTSGADLGWTDAAGSHWDVYVIATGGAAPVLGTTPTANDLITTSYTYAAGSANTTYDWYVRTDCGQDNTDVSTWTGPSTFTTACNAFTVTFSENYDGVTTPDLPDCWSNLLVGASSYAYAETSTTSSNSAPNNVRMYNSGSTGASVYIMLITPELSDLTSQSNQIRFQGRVSSYAQNLVVGTMSDPTDETTFTAFQTIALSINSYTEHTVMFDASYTLTDKYIAFRHEATVNYIYMNIDDFVYEPIPSCPPPTALVHSNESINGADLEWTDASGTYWDLYIVPTGDPAPTSGSSPTIDNTQVNPYTWSGGIAGTTYDWYVRRDCGQPTTNNSDVSTWTGPDSFTTLDGKATNPTPADGASGIAVNAKTFDWDDVAGATSYTIDIGTATGLSDLVNDGACPASTYTYTGADWDNSEDYFWTVSTLYSGGTVVGDEWDFLTAPGPHTLPLTEDFESGFTYFDNAPGNDVDWAMNTSIFHGGAQSAHNAYGSSNANVLHETGILDLSATTAATLSFWQIAKTEGDYDKCYVEVSTDGGGSYAALTAGDYQGSGSGYGGDGYFCEDDYSEWGTGTQSPDNTWWKEETFSLASYNVANVRFRFRLTSDGSGNRAGWYVDDIQIFEASCPAPSAQVETNITDVGADLGWTDAAGSHWDVYVVPTGDPAPVQGTTPTANDVTTNPYTYATGSANTTYDWYVRSDCDQDNVGTSDWTGPSTFTTNCASVSAPWNEGFEGMASVGSGIIPDCMAEDGDWGTGDAPQSYGRDARTGTNYAYTNYGADDWLFSVGIDLTAGTSYDFSFWYVTDGLSGWTTLEAKYGTGQTSGDMTTAIGTPVSGPTNTTYVEYRGSFTPATTGIYYMGIHVVASTSPWYITFDDLLVEETPSCPAPTAQTEINFTTTGADLGWTDAAGSHWDVYVVPTGDPAPVQGTTPTADDVTTNPYTYAAGSANTTYDWYVRSDCDQDNVGTSSWTGPSTFTTNCDAFTATFSENYDGVTAPDLPNCWSSIEDATTTGAYVRTYTSSSPNSTPNHVRLYNSYDASATLILITPQLSDLTTQANQIRFYAKSSSSGYDLFIGTMTDPADKNTFTNFSTISLTSTYTEYTVLFNSSYTGTNQYIAFKHGLGGTYRSIYIDDFVYEPIPSCPPPTAQTESNITGYQADLGWTTGGSSTWDIEWGTNGFTQGSGTMLTGVTSNPYTLAGLSPTTDYDWYVRDNCGGGDESTWIGPSTFTTDCGNYTPYYSQDFETYVPTCWYEANGPVGSAPVAGSSDWTQDDYLNVPANGKSAKVNLYDTGTEDWLISPTFDLTGGGYELNFNVAVTEYSSSDPSDMGSDDEVQLLVSTDGGTTWTNLMTWNIGNTPSNTGDNTTVDVSPYTSTTRFGFWGGEGTVDDPEDYDFFVDEFKVRVPPTASATWTGSTNNDWFVVGNWTGGVPGSITNVTIPGGFSNYPTIAAAAECNNLIVESGPGGDASILGDGNLTVNGTSTVQRYVTGGVWHDVSASTQGQTLQSLYFGGSPNVWLAHYNEPDNTRTFLSTLTDPMDPGAGFEIWVEATRYNVTIDYTGALQTTDVVLTTTSTPALSYTVGTPQSDYGYNLIGNPFASPINLNVGAWNRTDVSTSFWVWDPTGAGTYKDWNTATTSGELTGGIVPMGQGFFIQATNSAPSITIPMASRVHSPQGFYKAARENEQMNFSMQAIEGENKDGMNIAFLEGATDEFDIYDTRKMFAEEGGAPQIYSVQNEEKLGINGLPMLTETETIVNLSYRVGVTGEQTLIADLSGLENTEVVLEDIRLDAFQSLNSNPVYVFEGSIHNDSDRFLLHFTRSLTGIDNNNEDAPGIYSYDGAIYIKSSGKLAETDKDIFVYDMFGRAILQTKASASTLVRIPMAVGNSYFVVKVIADNKVYTSKVFIK